MRELYKAAREGLRLTQRYGQQVHYLGIGKHLSVYNATPPVWLNVGGKMRRVSVGRVEHPDDWAHARIMFFERKAPTEYYLIDGAPVFYGEDPAVTTVGDEIVLSSVNVSAIVKNEHRHSLKTEIRRADDVMRLWECWRSIPGKDNRITPIDNGTRIAVVVRPQGGEAGLGKMAYIELDNLNDLCEDASRAARIIEIPNADDTWVGPNELHNLGKKNQIGILAHGAFENGTSIPQGKTYFIFFVWLDRKSLQIVDIVVLAIREDYPASNAKTPALCNEAFGTGLMISSEPSREYAELYAGIGDLTQAFVRIHNPKIIGLYD